VNWYLVVVVVLLLLLLLLLHSALSLHNIFLPHARLEGLFLAEREAHMLRVSHIAPAGEKVGVFLMWAQRATFTTAQIKRLTIQVLVCLFACPSVARPGGRLVVVAGLRQMLLTDETLLRVRTPVQYIPSDP